VTFHTLSIYTHTHTHTHTQTALDSVVLKVCKKKTPLLYTSGLRGQYDQYDGVNIGIFFMCKKK